MIGVGILGAGHFGAVHARAIAAVDGVRLVAACREDEDGALAFAARHGGKPYSDWRALLADPAVDAVVIATPHHMHTGMAIAAATAGKHILLEKPMAPTVAECDAINAAVARAGVKLMIGHVMHFALPCLKARQVLETGALGRPVLGSSWMIKLWMEENRRPWHLATATGGGMLMTAGIHALDRLIWLMGGDVAGVQALSGAAFHDQEADDSVLALIRFADGRLGQLASVGYRDGAVTFAMDLVCERGTIRIDFDRGVEVGQGGVWTPVPQSHDPAWMQAAVEGEWRAMVAAIRDGVAVPVDGGYGRAVVAAVAAIRDAAAARREVAPAPNP
jgi:predicted dehydrogenase